jgi:hypothetical protein
VNRAGRSSSATKAVADGAGELATPARKQNQAAARAGGGGSGAPPRPAQQSLFGKVLTHPALNF